MSPRAQSLLNSQVIDVRGVASSSVGPCSSGEHNDHRNDSDDDDDDDDDDSDDGFGDMCTSVDDVDLDAAITEGIRVAHPSAIWIAALHKNIRAINNSYLRDFVRKEKKVYRVVANHVGTKVNVPPPDAETQNRLYQVQGCEKGGIRQLHVTHLDLCVGTRVRLTENTCVEAGLFNGAMGTVMGFVYAKADPTQVAKPLPYLLSSLVFSKLNI